MTSRLRWTQLLRYGWPVLVLLGILWFPFDWLSTVWPLFGGPFRAVFHNAHDHFIGHMVFFGIVGVLVLAYLPGLRSTPQWYLLGVVLAALLQETIQAVFRHQVPTFTDVNAFNGDALGAALAWVAVFLLAHFGKARHPSQVKHP
ncbi:MAG: hypothetical protein H0X24_10875 [Ktedonobacterales bacterium]|nr:hypothetical protein [Ktedonobacterales bacterium]